MSGAQKNSFFLLTAIVIIVALLTWYLFVSQSYPYYFQWDMDFTTSVDTLLINSALLPDHIEHPGFGMNLALCASQKLAHRFGILSIAELKELANSLNPLACMAELTDFIRLHSPFVVLAIVVLLALTLKLLTGISQWSFLFFLAAIGTQGSLTYHASLVRSELYSVFYWSIAVFLIFSAAKSSHARAKKWGFFCAGISLGLAFLSKAQSFSYILALIPLYFLANSLFQGTDGNEIRHPSRRETRVTTIISLANLIVFSLLCVASYKSEMPKELWQPAFYFSPLSAIFLVSLSSLSLIQLRLATSRVYSLHLSSHAAQLTFAATGFTTAFLLYFLIYPEISASLQYLLLNFKWFFFGKFEKVDSDIFLYYRDNLFTCFSYNPALFFSSIILNLLLIAGFKFSFIRLTKKQLLLYLLVNGFAAIVIVFGSRPFLRDLIWTETLLNFVVLLGVTFLIARSIRLQRLLRLVSLGFLSLIIFFNYSDMLRMPIRIDAEANHWGWRAEKWFSHVYPNNHLKYSSIMDSKYSDSAKPVALKTALMHKDIKRIVEFVFKNQRITHKNIGVVWETFPAWTADQRWKLALIPTQLRLAILVDNGLLPVKKDFFFKENLVRERNWNLDKIKKVAFNTSIAVLTRPDLKVYLFVLPDDAARITCDEIQPTPYHITLENNNEALILQGMEIKNYSEIPLQKLAHRFFFVINTTY